MIYASKYIFKATIFIHAEFIHKVQVFPNISISEISNISLKLYFSQIFILNTVLEITSRTVFLEKLTYTFILRSHFAFNIILSYIDGKLLTRRTVWRIIRWNRLRNVEVIVIYLTILSIIKLPQNNTTTVRRRNVNPPCPLPSPHPYPIHTNLYFSDSLHFPKSRIRC